MRKFLLFVISSVLLQMIAAAQSPISYSNVYTIEGKSANELFLIVKEWVAKEYVSSQTVTQMADNNKVVIKANQLYDEMSAHHVIDYTLTIECRDGRYRWTMDGFCYGCRWMTNPRYFSFGLLTDAEAPLEHSSFFGAKRCSEFWQHAKEHTISYNTALSNNLYDYIQKSVSDTENDW